MAAGRSSGRTFQRLGGGPGGLGTDSSRLPLRQFAGPAAVLADRLSSARVFTARLGSLSAGELIGALHYYPHVRPTPQLTTNYSGHDEHGGNPSRARPETRRQHDQDSKSLRPRATCWRAGGAEEVAACPVCNLGPAAAPARRKYEVERGGGLVRRRLGSLRARCSPPHRGPSAVDSARLGSARLRSARILASSVCAASRRFAMLSPGRHWLLTSNKKAVRHYSGSWWTRAKPRPGHSANGDISDEALSKERAAGLVN